MGKFIDLIQELLANHITANEFQEQYIKIWRLQRDTNEVVNSIYKSEVIEVIDTFFGYVDAYTDNLSLVGKYCNIGEAELRDSAQRCLNELLNLR